MSLSAQIQSVQMRRPPEFERPVFDACVVNKQQWTTNMLRLTLQSDDFSDFPHDCVGGYIKLIFHPEGHTDIHDCHSLRDVVLRTYSIRHFDPNACQLVLDMVTHDVHLPLTKEQGGYASQWGQQVSVGEHIFVAGPGLIAPIHADCDSVILASDMTGLPALAAQLETLPATAQGAAFIAVRDMGDQQVLRAPSGIAMHWLVQGERDLVAEVQAYPWPAGLVGVWCACEFDQMRTLRRYFRNEREVAREHLYISSYWKLGVTEDGHKTIKRQDSENNA
ncbi:Vibriobactin utilization protein ViuB [Vibrio stylophorae]|uniref:Vibriobactin utilization protein ViuB n=1 Tax=Vibrio stylophorae TaxID=659351 RepID=A0ABM8ZWW9_9VIBR|nr:siderophore-interacting protein [Vibrio stylophorae]CAH0535147.1 Vibriobactin utilization protein ViuB [Vibrio stylophorae]